MKAIGFEYRVASDLDAALATLAQHGDDVRPLAGGQSLVAALNMRLAAPALVLDIGRLTALKGMHEDGSAIRLGALTTHREIEVSPLLARAAPLLAKAAPAIAHPSIRNRGTLGGSLALADPAAEWPACMLALDARLQLRSVRGERWVRSEDFFEDVYTTALKPDELLIAAELPMAAAHTVFLFDEFARRHGDFALAGLATAATMSEGRVVSLRLAYFGVGPRPLLATLAAGAIVGSQPAAAVDAALEALGREIDPPTDHHASAAYRRHLAGVLLRRHLAALEQSARIEA